MSDIKDNNKKDYNNKGLRNRSGKDSTNEDKNKPIAKLLVVDDDPDIARVLKLALLKNRFLVNVFTRPEEALQNFQFNSKDFC